MKHIIKHGVLAKLESVYGTAVTLAASTDGVLVTESPNVALEYSFDGALQGKAPGTAGRLQRVGREGRAGAATLMMHGRGAGAAYSASVLPGVHVPMRFTGFDATVGTTGGSESVIYTPSAEDTYASATLEVYARKQKYPFVGVYGDSLKISGEFGGVPMWEFPFKGIVPALPTDAAVPAITYNTTEPAKAVQAAVQITSGGTTFAPVRVKSFELEMKRSLTARAFDNVNGIHGGFHPGPVRECTLSLLIEMVDITTATPWVGAATLNPYKLGDIASLCAVSFTVGSTQYRRWKVNAATAQLAENPYQEEGAVSHWNLKFDMMPSSLITNDEFSITFD